MPLKEPAKILRALFCLPLLAASHVSATPGVVTTIQPLHALAQTVSSGVFEPQLLIGQHQSPHDYRLTPASARVLAKADLVIWIGKQMETQIAIPLQNLTPVAKHLTVSELAAIQRLPARSGGIWQAHSEHDEQHADLDPHLWLDAGNAIVIIEAIATRLSALDPAHADIYNQNAQRGIENITAADRTARTLLQAAQPKPYWVLHDTLQYFEQRYALHPAGAVMISPERKPGAKRMLELRRQLREQNIGCILYEERYGRRWIDALIENSSAKAISMDPLGLEIKSGAGHYEQLLLNLAQQLSNCR